MKIAILTTDSREHYRDYTNPVVAFGTAPEALLQGFAQLPDAEVHVLSCAHAPMKSPEKLAPNIFFHSLLVPKNGWMRTFYLGCIRAVRGKLREIRPDIVHGQGTERDCAVSAVFSGFANVLTVHGNMRLIAEVNHAKPFSFLWLAAKLEQFTVPRTNGVVCITHYTQEAVRDLTKRTWVVPNAVDASFFDVNSQPSANKPPRILCVGNACLRKNQNAFIRALDPLATRHKFELKFLGIAVAGRPYDDEFLQLVRERPWCVFGGMASREQLKQELHEATALALPSLEDNCPMVVLEAMAAGVPVVAARVGGLPDLVEDGKTGFFCDPLNPQSMCEAIEKVFSAGPEVTVLAARAKQEALARFHPKIVASRHLEIYNEVLAGGRH
ncbi:MAG TPA: glycosyltransferase family 4 protein [Verrucomicrobiae bacterium]|jgi:glycosyltransferase involved in cell wall biosynthesis|nr:glycosyltransferase family 4 protein [Verrucomicrobiae bacterium]